MAFAAIAGAANRHESGTYVDLAARDALLWTLTSSFLVNSANKPMKRLGNSHETSFPHGVFKCAGHDQWVSISVDHETKRQAIYSLIGRTDIAELALMSESDKQSVEHALEAWASQFEAKRVVIQLQAMGVAAFASVDSKDIWEDKHLRAREVFRHVEDIGWVAAPPWRRVGQQEQLPTTCKLASARKRVFNEILGIELDVIEQMLVRGVIG
jgi:crotonobetainyl-CoA:carnitine CoA-transferase CaiB-like acyl-CoA transferase